MQIWMVKSVCSREIHWFARVSMSTRGPRSQDCEITAAVVDVPTLRAAVASHRLNEMPVASNVCTQHRHSTHLSNIVTIHTCQTSSQYTLVKHRHNTHLSNIVTVHNCTFVMWLFACTCVYVYWVYAHACKLEILAKAYLIYTRAVKAACVWMPASPASHMNVCACDLECSHQTIYRWYVDTWGCRESC